MSDNPLHQFESDQRILNELRELFDFAPPAQLRRSLEDFFFTFFTTHEEPSLPNQQEILKNFYYLINFLNEVESQERS